MLSLEAPSELLRVEFLDMADDFTSHGESRYARAREDFEGFLSRIANEAAPRVPEPGRVPCSWFWLLFDRRVVGCSRLRHRLTEELEYEGGHIGYDVRPSERGQGFGNALLELTLPKAAALGIVQARVTCDASNLASIGVIEHNGGVLDATVPSRSRQELIRQYWIATAPPSRGGSRDRANGDPSLGAGRERHGPAW